MKLKAIIVAAALTLPAVSQANGWLGALEGLGDGLAETSYYERQQRAYERELYRQRLADRQRQYEERRRYEEQRNHQLRQQNVWNSILHELNNR